VGEHCLVDNKICQSGAAAKKNRKQVCPHSTIVAENGSFCYLKLQKANHHKTVIVSI